MMKSDVLLVKELQSDDEVGRKKRKLLLVFPLTQLYGYDSVAM